MTTGFTLIPLLPVASFAIAAGGLAVRLFWPDGPAKRQLIVASFIFVVLASGLMWRQQREEEREAREEESQVRKTADDIVRVIGSEKRTYEEILSGLRKPDYRIANEAIDLLVAEKDIGSELRTVAHKSGPSFLIRLYYKRAF